MEFLIKEFKINGNNEIKSLYNNLIKVNLQFQIFNLDSNSILKSNTYYIYKSIYNYILFTSKQKIFLRNINYLQKQIISTKFLKNNLLKYKLTNKNNTLKLLLLSFIIFFYFHMLLQNNIDIKTKNKYLLIKKLYNLLKIYSTIIPKLFFDKLLNKDELEVILKMFILFSINNYNNKEIKENNNIENIMYLKECLNIIKIIYNSSIEEQNMLINIINYININICYINKDKNNLNYKINKDNNNFNYTNKFYMIHNDHKTTKLLSLMNIIDKLNNSELNNAYFELLSNIYYFQFSYNKFNWPFYRLFEPLLVNIDKKNYSTILNEISFPNFQLNFIKYLIDKEKIFIENNPCILKNGFYFGENNNNSGIIAEIGKLEDNFIITFGFKLLIKNEHLKQKEFIVLQIKNINDNKSQLIVSIKKKSDSYSLVLIDNKKNEKNIVSIIPCKYYIFSLQIKDSNLYVVYRYDNFPTIFFEVKKFHFKINNNLFICVGCDVEPIKLKNKKFHKNYKYTNKFTGFIGDVHIINTKSYINKDKNKDINNIFNLQEYILDFKGKYGYIIPQSILKQENLNEYITTNILDFKIKKGDKFIRKDEKEEYKIIDNICLYITSKNFKLINYMDKIDYLNYDSNYDEKEKLLNEIHKEYQYFNNYRIKRNEDNNNNKIVEINTKLFNCNFNIFENRSSLVKLIEEDWIFYLILILEYYYQVIYKIYIDILEKEKNENNKNEINNSYISNEQKQILNSIENGIENIIIFFENKIYGSYLNIKQYKMKLFYYQINVVIKQYILIQNINEQIYRFLIKFLENYQELINKNFNKINDDKDLYIEIRDFFFDFLLNPDLYKKSEKFNLLKNLNKLFALLNQIIEENMDNMELLQNKIFYRLLFFVFLFKFINHMIVFPYNSSILIKLHKKVGN